MSWFASGASMVCRPLGDLLFPQHCTCCRAACADWLCDTCGDELAEVAARPRCGVCAAPLPIVDAPCPRCSGRRRRPIATVARLGTHAGTLRELIHKLKYSHHWSLAEPLARALREQMTVESLLQDADYLVPIPLHWRRRITRGYNQSELLARELARGTHARVINALQRTRNTPKQTSIHSVSERLRNVRDAFTLRRNGADLRGQRVVLIDDVFTTGATLRAAARALTDAGPAQIDAIVLAMADPENRGFTTI